jgi:FAD/FMN-containing dehydrogenase
MYTYRWVSLLVWPYFTEGVVRATSDRGRACRWPRWRSLLCLSCSPPAACTCAAPAEEGSHGDLIEQLRAAVGAANVLTEGDLSAWEQDWRKRVRGKALAVVRPGSTRRSGGGRARLRRRRHAHRAAGRQHRPGGGRRAGRQSGREVVLSLTRMNRVRAIDRANLTMTVDAGCVLQNLQQAAEDAGFLFPLSLAAEGSCTIGGNLATNAGGTQVLRYGNTRELCLGLEVVTAQGEVWDGLAGLRKDNTGYDLRDLFIGSEGTLGVITGAT